MTDEQALRRCRARDPEGLSQIIGRYTGYVSAVIWNIGKQRLSREDAEELCADVFVSLWQTPERAEPEKLRAWLGAVARNKARNALRQRGVDLSLEEDILELPEDGPEARLEAAEQKKLLRDSVEAMPQPDREIFLRFYYYSQSTPVIAREMRLSPSAVRQRLARGRERLRRNFILGGMME